MRRRRLLLAGWGFVLGTGTASAQLTPIPVTAPKNPAIPSMPAFPGPVVPAAPTYPGPVAPAAPTFPRPDVPLSPQYPSSPLPPNPLPPLGPTMPARPEFPPPGAPAQGPQNPLALPQEIPLPQPENKFALSARDVTLKRVLNGWQIWGGQKVLRDFGDRENDARDALRVYQDLRPTEWATIGGPKPVVEYPLVNGRPPAAVVPPATGDPRHPNAGPPNSAAFNGPAATGAGAKVVIPIDLRTVRVEPVRGAWVVRDDDNIHLNFGPVKADAEQALAVVRRYGFNRVGVVGQPTSPAMTYLFVSPDGAPNADKGPLGRAALQSQIDGLNRVGIPVPGVGYVGEMVHIDPRKLDVRKDGGDWIVASGTEVLGRFGPSEYAARDAARTMADAKFTEFCKLGSAGITFFLTNGKAPTKVPFNAQGRRFDPGALKVQQQGAKWVVTENGRHVFDCASAEEGETLVRVVKSFGFDQLCHFGPSPRQGVSFLAKGQ